VPPVAAKVEE
jgi:hypothetical protein